MRSRRKKSSAAKSYAQSNAVAAMVLTSTLSCACSMVLSGNGTLPVTACQRRTQ